MSIELKKHVVQHAFWSAPLIKDHHDAPSDMLYPHLIDGTMAAHALLQALEEGSKSNSIAMSWRCEVLLSRASELIEQWKHPA